MSAFTRQVLGKKHVGTKLMAKVAKSMSKLLKKPGSTIGNIPANIWKSGSDAVNDIGDFIDDIF